ncbi:enoyl-[acyl-carrier-protein] reductase [NADH] 1, chloroplastic-like [Nymphaea colorata]|nr:enoyl-[acyl-carrier-protein] reductase [NADH] 1, chloroplastic-like [Nymphaea colorata]
MAAATASKLQIATSRPYVSSGKLVKPGFAVLRTDFGGYSNIKISSSFISSAPALSRCYVKQARKHERVVTKAMSGVNGDAFSATSSLDLRGKRAFIAGVADDNGYGWAIAKSLAAAGAEILLGTWVPALNIFETSLRRGKFDESRLLPNGSLMEIAKVYALDAVYDCPEDVPEDVKTNKRYAGSSNWTVQEVAECVKCDYGTIDILVHSLANGPEVTKPLLETSRGGYLAAISASSYSYVSLLKHFLPIMNPGGSSISLTYIASEKIIPGYGGGMSSAKAALESDTRVLAFEAGRKHKVRVNTISAGPLRSRAAKAIGFIDMMIDYSLANAPLPKELLADEVGNVAAFLASPMASAMTGNVVYVDNGLHAMGVGVDSPVFSNAGNPKSEGI